MRYEVTYKGGATETFAEEERSEFGIMLNSSSDYPQLGFNTGFISFRFSDDRTVIINADLVERIYKVPAEDSA